MRYDEQYQTELVGTLSTYLGHDCNLAATASTLFTHRHTVRYRLDRIAELKRTDAILCDAANLRISDRLLARFGWESHAPGRWSRNFIKRFYGVYPGCPSSVVSCERLRAAATDH